MASTRDSCGMFKYPRDTFRHQRILGPMPGAPLPPSGSEIFVRRLPEEANEYDLLPFFSIVGRVYKLRLMMQMEAAAGADGAASRRNRGYAFVTYESPEVAAEAAKVLQTLPFWGGYVIIEKSFDNCRLFIGGVPDNLDKDSVWKELLRQGMSNIVDVIMYRSYTDRARNRGFVFVEFDTHQHAAEARCHFRYLKLWGQKILIDWSTPLPNVENRVLEKVKVIFLRNLTILEQFENFQAKMKKALSRFHLEKVYKFKDYAFIHFSSRNEAEHGLEVLKDYYKGTNVEVTWAIPQQYAPKKHHAKFKSNRSDRSVDEILPITELDMFLDFEPHNFKSSMDVYRATPSPPIPRSSSPYLCISTNTEMHDGSIPRKRYISESSAVFSGASNDSGICTDVSHNESFVHDVHEDLLAIPDEYLPKFNYASPLQKRLYKRKSNNTKLPEEENLNMPLGVLVERVINLVLED